MANRKGREKVAHRFLTLVFALLLAAGVLPLKAGADAPCVPATVEVTVPAAATFVLPPHTLATLRWPDRWSAEIFRVPLSVQVTVVNGYGSFRSYSPANCTESQLEWTARDEAWRTGRTVGDIYSMPTRLQVSAVGYYPAPVPYVPVPQPAPVPYPTQPVPVVPPLPYPYAPGMPEPCGPISPVGVDPAQKVYGAAVLEARFPDYSSAVVTPLAGGWEATVSGATSLVVWQAPGCGGDVLAWLMASLAQGGRVSFDSAPSQVQNRFSRVRRP